MGASHPQRRDFANYCGKNSSVKITGMRPPAPFQATASQADSHSRRIG
jgi:hypothetical protein